MCWRRDALQSWILACKPYRGVLHVGKAAGKALELVLLEPSRRGGVGEANTYLVVSETNTAWVCLRAFGGSAVLVL